ncbi:hypothetical protein [Streptomyces rishiriensis]|uniref:Membrane-bound metal-dependent hydrolase YbcI (DUF457 family) n=1 Tax=Streptomyces rishiriensis TaxID=68264 RepID=A0ABU0P3T3_STRRH|nr:hypothetical protein [Streptomyces rishiriensis]MDQ0585608.1 membrane-bound metal-dependent hydrolase YbcI (DUF457 family) [Streptomyces rishiriensis]
MLPAAVGERGRMESRRVRGCLGMVVGLALSVLTAMVLGRGWNACDVGVNNAANSGFLVFLLIPGLWVVLLLSWLAVGALLGHRPLLHAVGLAVTLVAEAWCVISIFWGGVSPYCPGGVPPWWPGLVPVPGF